MKKNETAPKRRARKCLPIDSCSRMSDPISRRFVPGVIHYLFNILKKVLY